ncbi:hypothetical protein KBD61_02310 [Patescibacteria group bacterium]|nr:hypothetical protein [Patescibacteria group bacterium]MBP9709842.1 hypothetical protein [Patescibacteria group bacterium]
MEQPFITVETPKDSTILAYGTAPGFGYRRALVWGLILISTLIISSLLWWGLSRPLPMSAQTLIVVTRPSAAQEEVPERIREQLPEPWRVALKSGSRWPVALGGGLGPNGWTWFAVVPRWVGGSAGLPQTQAGLGRILYDQAPLGETSAIRYLDGMKTWLRHPLQQASGSFALGDVSTSSTMATFTYEKDIVRTSLPFEHRVTGFTPRMADISVNLSALTGVTRDELLHELPIPQFAVLPEVQEAHFIFGTEGVAESIQLVHSETVSKERVKAVLAGFGVTTKRVIQLADGTLATELTSGDGEMNAPVRLRTGESLFIQDRDIRYGSSTEPFPTITAACGERPVVGRVSASALQKLVQGIGLMFDLSSITGWQLGEDEDGNMILCKE